MRGDLGGGVKSHRPEWWSYSINKGSWMVESHRLQRRANGLAKQAKDRSMSLMSTVLVLTTVLRSLVRSPVPERE